MKHPQHAGSQSISFDLPRRTYTLRLPQMSCSQIDPDLEEKLNDIDELIQSELLGFQPLSDGRVLKPTDVASCSCSLQTLELPNRSTFDYSGLKLIGQKFKTSQLRSLFLSLSYATRRKKTESVIRWSRESTFTKQG